MVMIFGEFFVAMTIREDDLLKIEQRNSIMLFLIDREFEIMFDGQ